MSRFDQKIMTDALLAHPKSETVSALVKQHIYALERNAGLEDTFANIRKREPYSKNEAITKYLLAQEDLNAARELIDILSAELSELKGK